MIKNFMNKWKKHKVILIWTNLEKNLALFNKHLKPVKIHPLKINKWIDKYHHQWQIFSVHLLIIEG